MVALIVLSHALSALISACGSPAVLCQPSAITLSFLVMTQPTSGLGLQVYFPYFANRIACDIN